MASGPLRVIIRQREIKFFEPAKLRSSHRGDELQSPERVSRDVHLLVMCSKRSACVGTFVMGRRYTEEEES
jgi:hypothetical protein